MRPRKTNSVLKIVPALTARTQLGQILRRVKQNKERFVVDRRGEPQAVIMSVEEYLENFGRAPGVLQQIRISAMNRRKISMRTINMEIKRSRRELSAKK
jgi:prevent-host-death family protein